MLAVREKPRDLEIIDGGGCAPPWGIWKLWKIGVCLWSTYLVGIVAAPYFADDSDVVNLVMSAMA